MNPEFAAPPDLMKRFIETPFRYSVVRNGCVIEIHTNEPLQELEVQIQHEESPTFRWWIIQEDKLLPQRSPRTIAQDELLTIVGEDGSLTVIDLESREAYSFTTRSSSAITLLEQVMRSNLSKI